MPLILDGHNVLFAMAAGGKRVGADALDAAQQELVQGLIRHYNASGEAATVVLDSRQLRGGARFEKTLPGVRVLFAHPPRTADDEILRLVEASTAPGRLRVVTSDREVMRACTGRGTQVVESRAFLREMGREAERSAKDEAEQCLKTGRPSREEVAELLAAFGEAAGEVRLRGQVTRLRPRRLPNRPRPSSSSFVLDPPGKSRQESRTRTTDEDEDDQRRSRA